MGIDVYCSQHLFVTKTPRRDPVRRTLPYTWCIRVAAVELTLSKMLRLLHPRQRSDETILMPTLLRWRMKPCHEKMPPEDQGATRSTIT